MSARSLIRVELEAGCEASLRSGGMFVRSMRGCRFVKRSRNVGRVESGIKKLNKTVRIIEEWVVVSARLAAVLRLWPPLRKPTVSLTSLLPLVQEKQHTSKRIHGHPERLFTNPCHQSMYLNEKKLPTIFNFRYKRAVPNGRLIPYAVWSFVTRQLCKEHYVIARKMY
ncbi:uncharacterized protein LOC143143830 [Ptiloglossa arizonensis]|uniref:uncharacterized protein LOC143143830 n=1 Tax=Ptiloglossa arizonensis TaxID=3350558 RepID=UPI003F9F1F24